MFYLPWELNLRVPTPTRSGTLGQILHQRLLVSDHKVQNKNIFHLPLCGRLLNKDAFACCCFPPNVGLVKLWVTTVIVVDIWRCAVGGRADENRK